MNQTQTLDLIAAVLRDAGHPEIAEVAVLDTPTVRANMGDGSTNYFKVAHVAKSGDRVPDRPSWPGIPTATAVAGGGR